MVGRFWVGGKWLGGFRRGKMSGEISTISLYYCLHKFFISVQKFFEIFFSSLDSDWSYCLEKNIKNVLTSLTYLFSFIGCVDVLWHFEFYILKCKNYMIDFLDELGNFKQKIFYTLKCKFFLHFRATDPFMFFGHFFHF